MAEAIQMLKIRDAAKRLGVQPATVRQWIWRRRIEYHKIGRAVRIPSTAVEAILARGLRPALERQ